MLTGGQPSLVLGGHVVLELPAAAGMLLLLALGQVGRLLLPRPLLGVRGLWRLEVGQYTDPEHRRTER